MANNDNKEQRWTDGTALAQLYYCTVRNVMRKKRVHSNEWIFRVRFLSKCDYKISKSHLTCNSEIKFLWFIQIIWNGNDARYSNYTFA